MFRRNGWTQVFRFAAPESFFFRLLLLSASTCLAVGLAKAQTASQSTGGAGVTASTSSSSSANTANSNNANSANKDSSGQPPGPPGAAQTPKPQSPHLTAFVGPPMDEVNRKTLEKNAGLTPAKLLVRSAPSGAQVYVEDVFVGRTPVMLVLAPRLYHVRVRDSRDDSAAQLVGLLANDSQDIDLTLSPKYPSVVGFGNK